MQLRNRNIFITGGTSGIGRELVRQLAPCNTAIVVISRNPVKLKNLQNEFSNVVTYQCSLADKMDLEKSVSDIREKHPDISVVINNAGIQETPTFLDNKFSYDSIDTEIEVNLAAPIKICALMLGPLLQLGQPSALINVSSGLALYPKKSSAVYCATKAGLHNFSRSLRYQLEGTTVSVYEAIMPLVDTPMTEGRGKGKISAREAAKAIICGVESDTQEIYVGKAKWIPMMSRICPSLMAKIMKSA